MAISTKCTSRSEASIAQRRGHNKVPTLPNFKLAPMTTSTHDDLDFISSICSNFADALNKTAGGCLFSGQDAYEALTAAFGNDFSEKDLRTATRQGHQALAKALLIELEFELATPDIAKSALEYALGSWV